TQPWILCKSEETMPRLQTVMYYLAECIRAIAVYITPTMPSTPAKIYEQLGLTDESLMTWDSVKTFGGLKAGTVVKKGAALFPRVDVKKELEILNPPAKEEEKKPEPKKEEKKAKAEEKKEEPKSDDGYVTIDEFFKTKLIAARVIACEKVEKSDKLLKSTLDIGNGETRTVLSGIAQWYAPEDMPGKTVVLVKNLPPRKMRGIMSEGMLLCASDNEGNLKLLTVDGGEFAPGSEIG
ncbi:MAG: methionine--tRNA ligase subunit beta, partial [Clostridia bacterium]|nr:methionine--tRNA ligase subunit beta [Clostridia bacterium]